MAAAAAVAGKRWCDMPRELLSKVADRLDLIDLLGFRTVCRDFHAACSSAIAKLVSSELPWFLTYGKPSSECSLLVFNNNHGWHKVFTLNIPGLEEQEGRTTVHGSSFGWLFVSKFKFFQTPPSWRGRLFFLHPFSGKRIDLLLPWNVLQIEDHVAAFSSPPSSHDCIVAIAGPVHLSEGFYGHECYLQLTVFSRSPYDSNRWERTFRGNYDRSLIGIIRGAVYCGGKFYFFDGKRKVMMLHTERNSVQFVDIPFPNPLVSPLFGLQDQGVFFTFSTRHVEKTGLRKMLGLDESFDISTCGTTLDNGTTVICSELTPQYVRIQGVWIRPS